MKYIENECCDCGLPCIYYACPFYRVEHFKCDVCGEEDVKLYHYEGKEVCQECILKEFEVVEGSDEYY